MVVLKACKRCQRDLYVESEPGQADLVCLQCGYRRALRSPVVEMLERQERKLEEATV